MSLKERMAESQSAETARQAARNHLMETDRNYRTDKKIELWDRMPAFHGLKDMPLTEARGTALKLDNQLKWLSNLEEAQVKAAFDGFTPENMLRLVRLSYPNSIRSKVFTDFTLESFKDSIKYVRPVYSTTQNGKKLNDRNTNYTGEDGEDAWGTNKTGSTQDADDTYRKAMYEQTEDRYAQELANVKGTSTAVAADATMGTATKATEAGTLFTFPFYGAKDTDAYKFGASSERYIDGYIKVYGKSETDVIAEQVKSTKKFRINADYTGAKVWVEVADDGKVTLYVFVSTASVTADATTKVSTSGQLAASLKVRAFGRFDSETDFEGNYLGEVELVMEDHMFNPRPTSIGVTWSLMSELSMSYSFNISAQDYLVTYASQEIRIAQDYRALKIAYSQAKLNGADYLVKFDAGYADTTKEGYFQNAQTFISAIDAIGDKMLNNINRGGVSRAVGGPSAASYCHLMNCFSPKGAGTKTGAHQIGMLDTIPLFKVPSSIIPNDEMLCVWKNDDNENDVSIAFGTLLPFYATGVIERKNFYKEAAIDSIGDYAVLQRKYLTRIVIENMKDAVTN